MLFPWLEPNEHFFRSGKNAHTLKALNYIMKVAIELSPSVMEANR